jgi:hypothetical protein
MSFAQRDKALAFYFYKSRHKNIYFFCDKWKRKLNLPQHDLPKSKRTNCTMYGSRRFTYHQGIRSDFVSEHVSDEKNDEVDPSMAFCGIPGPSVDICIGAFPAATFNTAKIKE